MEVIAIGGGTGSGKSTVAYELVDSGPERFEVLNLDDYQKVGSSASIPTVEGMENWDHPDVVDWDRLQDDIKALRDGDEIQLKVWAHRSNVNFAQTRQRIPRVVIPRPVVIVEGYLALYGAMAGIYDKAFYLDLDENTRLERRRQARHGNDCLSGNPRYNELILQPMHKQYVEPTKANADIVIDVAHRTPKQIAQLILKQLAVQS